MRLARFPLQIVPSYTWQNYNVYVGDPYQWCFSRNANIMNLSFSSNPPGNGDGLSGLDMKHDFLVKQWPYPTIVTATENDGNFVESRSFNTIIVGARFGPLCIQQRWSVRDILELVGQLGGSDRFRRDGRTDLYDQTWAD